MPNEFAFKIGILLGVFALPIKLVALVLPWWTYVETDFFGDELKTNLGLWKYCQDSTAVSGDIITTCRSFMEPDEYIVTSRCLLTFGLLLLGAGLFAVCVQYWFFKQLVLLAFLGSLLVCIAGCLTWIAVVTYAEQYVNTPGNRPQDIHASWIMALISSMFSYVSGICFAARRI